MAWKCPVCDDEVIEIHKDYLDGHTLLEWEDRCPNGCTEGKMHYGCHWERIGPYEWQWDHHETPEQAKKRQLERQAAINEMKRIRTKQKQKPVKYEA